MQGYVTTKTPSTALSHLHLHLQLLHTAHSFECNEGGEKMCNKQIAKSIEMENYPSPTIRTHLIDVICPS